MRAAKFLSWVLVIALLGALAAGGYAWYRYADAHGFGEDQSLTVLNLSTGRDLLNYVEGHSSMTCDEFLDHPTGIVINDFSLNNGIVRLDFTDVSTHSVVHELVDQSGVYTWHDASKIVLQFDLDTPLMRSTYVQLPTVKRYSCRPQWQTDPAGFSLPEDVVIQARNS